MVFVNLGRWCLLEGWGGARQRWAGPSLLKLRNGRLRPGPCRKGSNPNPEVTTYPQPDAHNQQEVERHHQRVCGAVDTEAQGALVPGEATVVLRGVHGSGSETGEHPQPEPRTTVLYPVPPLVRKASWEGPRCGPETQPPNSSQALKTSSLAGSVPMLSLHH